ncbi:MAG: hypothetical protein ACOH1T_10165 [Microbacteriaceae bacterium]
MTTLLVVTLMVSACTASTPDTTTQSDALSYVNLLRGENDLAHGSLEIPATSTLPALAAAYAALRHAQRTVPNVSVHHLEQLTVRSGEEPIWAAFYLCEATGGDRQTVGTVLGAEALRGLLTFPTVAVRSANDVADRIVAERARACLAPSSSSPSTTIGMLDRDTRAALDHEAAGNALLGAQLAQLYRAQGDPPPTGIVRARDIARLNAALAADGCTEWALANSAATVLLVGADGTSSGIRECARSTTTDITEPTSLAFALDAGMSPGQTAALLDHNADALSRWIGVEETTTTPGSTPVGLGTVASTRDALVLLRLRGVVTTPRWMVDGVAAASRDPRFDNAGATYAGGSGTGGSGTGGSGTELFDLLYLCDAVQAPCDAEFVTETTELLTLGLDALLASPENGADAARVLEVAIALNEFEPAEHNLCRNNSAKELYRSAPQLLAMLATAAKRCVEAFARTDAERATDVERALAELRPDDAVAYCLLRSLAVGATTAQSTFQTRSRRAFDELWLQFDADNGSDYLSTARPVRVELLHAQADQWLE